MSTKKQETAPRQQSQSPKEAGVPKGNTICIVHEDAASVKPANLLRRIEEGGAKASQMIAAVQRLYPGYEKTLHSKCRNGERYGVMLRPDAMSAIIAQFAPELRNAARRDVRTKPRRIQARLSEAVYGALQQALRARGVTVQQWIEDSALGLINQTDEGSGRDGR